MMVSSRAGLILLHRSHAEMARDEVPSNRLARATQISAKRVLFDRRPADRTAGPANLDFSPTEL